MRLKLFILMLVASLTVTTGFSQSEASVSGYTPDGITMQHKKPHHVQKKKKKKKKPVKRKKAAKKTVHKK
ncbi:MAG: hypothetical protein QM640_02685 [Niabella sp.]